ncbi:MAG: hypothetical protein JW749_02260 [Sedimentisphaerales bacterium]|nr:hypothetical protein [Sedimentisphaerales bacterium]
MTGCGASVIFGLVKWIVFEKVCIGAVMSMTLFWVIIICSAVAVVIGWIAYGIWQWRENKLEKERPKVRSERYQQATNSVAEYAKKLAEFKKPTYKREDTSSSETQNQKE